MPLHRLFFAAPAGRATFQTLGVIAVCAGLCKLRYRHADLPDLKTMHDNEPAAAAAEAPASAASAEKK